MMPYQPVIIIGAPRSGTNMLRDVLTSLSGVDTWPCDEINAIWRHGHVRFPSDEFTPDMANQAVCAYIRRQFTWVAGHYQAHTVVEKTCANSLRVGFVDRVVPEAKYIFIYRNGLDALASAMKRWQAAVDLPYLARKARFVPVADFPWYVYAFLNNRMSRFWTGENRLAAWGPKLEGMQNLVREYFLEEVCALQWKCCLERAADAFQNMASEKWIQVGYEDFVRAPEPELGRIANFCDLDIDKKQVSRAVSGVRAESIGKGRRTLGRVAVARVMLHIQETLARFGYEDAGWRA